MKRGYLNAVLVAGVMLVGSTLSWGAQRMSADEANAILKHKTAARDASLKAEGRVNWITRGEARRVQNFYAAKAAQETRELANYQRFKQDQRMAIAETSASRLSTVFTVGADGLPSEGMARRSAYRPVGALNRANAGAAEETRNGATERLAQYPDRYYAQQAREQGIDRAEAASLARQSFESGPVTRIERSESSRLIPSQDATHYLDIGGFQSGELIRDPSTGEVLRVP